MSEPDSSKPHVTAQTGGGVRRLRAVLPTLIGALLVWCCAAPALAGAATIKVNWTADELNPTDVHCSLREAVIAANTDKASGSNAGECTAGSGADTIKLPPGKYGLTNLGELDITSNLTIVGAGAGSTTVNAAGHGRVFEIGAGDTVTLRGLKITGGATAPGEDGASVTGSGPGEPGNGQSGTAGGSGGGILSAGTLTLENCIVTGNSTGHGGNGGAGTGVDGGGPDFGGSGADGGAGGDGGDGGGIASTGPALTLIGTSVTQNTTGYGGLGGVGTGGNSTNFESGGATFGGPGGNGGRGAGVYSTGRLIITRSKLDHNVTGNGGSGSQGFGGRGGSNTGYGGAGGEGIGADGGAGGAGGGVFTAGSTTVVDSDISGNRTGSGGGGADGVGGFGGNASDIYNGGAGGLASGGYGGAGGDGAGVDAQASLTASRDTIASNVAGAGGDGAASAIGGNGGNGGPSASGGGGTGGKGGWAQGGGGGAGGNGGIALGGTAIGSLTNDTITANLGGAGGSAGPATAGSGGNGGGTGNGADGGQGYGSNGGAGGWGAISSGTQLTIVQATVNANGGSAGGTGATGTGGQPGVAFGSGSDGNTGASAGGTAGSTGGGITASASTLVIENSILAANGSPGCGGAGAISDGGHNIAFGDGTCPGAQADPTLAALAANGGPTRTEALKSGSPAITMVPAADCAKTDQRGVGREHEPACDAGAYEREEPIAVTGSATRITATSASLHGFLTPNSASAHYSFKFGTTTAYGKSSPVRTAGGIAPVRVSAAVSGLRPHTTYHCRLVAASADGSTTGRDVTFTTR